MTKCVDIASHVFDVVFICNLLTTSIDIMPVFETPGKTCVPIAPMEVVEAPIAPAPVPVVARADEEQALRELLVLSDGELLDLWDWQMMLNWSDAGLESWFDSNVQL